MATSADAISAHSAFRQVGLVRLALTHLPQRTMANPADGGEPMPYYGAYVLFCRLAEGVASTPII